MAVFSVFLSVVFVVRNEAHSIADMLSHAAVSISHQVSDYELIIVDNASDDKSISVLKSLTGENGHPNLQVYALTKEVDTDTAPRVGLGSRGYRGEASAAQKFERTNRTSQVLHGRDKFSPTQAVVDAGRSNAGWSE